MRGALATIAACTAIPVAGIALVAEDVRAPWSGIATIVLAGALVAAGYAGGLVGVVLGPLVAAIFIVAHYYSGDEEPLPSDPGCDPSCGLTGADMLLIWLPVFVALAGLGAGFRRLVRWRRRRAGNHGR